jgi:hypothetical protein
MKAIQKRLALACAIVLWCGAAHASYCGAVSYLKTHLGGVLKSACECPTTCVSTMKTRQRIVHVPETRQVTKTVLERVAVPESVTVIQQVPETRYRDELYMSASELIDGQSIEVNGGLLRGWHGAEYRWPLLFSVPVVVRVLCWLNSANC